MHKINKNKYKQLFRNEITRHIRNNLSVFKRKKYFSH